MNHADFVSVTYLCLDFFSRLWQKTHSVVLVSPRSMDWGERGPGGGQVPPVPGYLSWVNPPHWGPLFPQHCRSFLISMTQGRKRERGRQCVKGVSKFVCVGRGRRGGNVMIPHFNWPNKQPFPPLSRGLGYIRFLQERNWQRRNFKDHHFNATVEKYCVCVCLLLLQLVYIEY